MAGPVAPRRDRKKDVGVHLGPSSEVNTHVVY